MRRKIKKNPGQNVVFVQPSELSKRLKYKDDLERAISTEESLEFPDHSKLKTLYEMLNDLNTEM